MSDNATGKPVTPRRSTAMQALSAFFRTPTLLRTPTTVNRLKRVRSRTSSSPSSPRNPVLPAVVLQTYSLSTDSIVLTSLPSVPFCCHEDLLTMSRTQLEGVVRALNERLPRRMRIAPEDDFWWNDDQERPAEDDGISRMSEAEMRRRIEELVGIRTASKNRVSKSGLGLRPDAAVPPAPKAIRTRGPTWKPYEIPTWEMEVDGDEYRDPNGADDSLDDALMGSSPLAFRSRTRSHPRGRSDAFFPLAILQEENEGGESKEDEDDEETRPSKKQRRSFEATTDHRVEGPEVTQGIQGSRLIENIDISASSLFTKANDSSFDSVAQPEEKSSTTSDEANDDNKNSKVQVQVPVLRRRSARIALKQACLADAEKNTNLDASRSRSSSLPAKPSRSSTSNSVQVEQSVAEKTLIQPREFTIRLPFTSTPPHLKPTNWASSAPRILRSQSQRLSAALKPGKSAKEKATLGRSRSERLPRALDLKFVTVDRPRYRFSRRKSKVAKVVTTDEKHESEKENDPTTTNNPKDNSIRVTPSGVHAFPLAPCNSLTPRSRAPSTSTVGSTCGGGIDSPARSTSKGATELPMNATSTTNEGVDDGVRAALGRMVVD